MTFSSVSSAKQSLTVNAVVAKCSTWDPSLKTTLKLLFFKPAKVVLKEVLEEEKMCEMGFPENMVLKEVSWKMVLEEVSQQQQKVLKEV